MGNGRSRRQAADPEGSEAVNHGFSHADLHRLAHWLISPEVQCVDSRAAEEDWREMDTDEREFADAAMLAVTTQGAAPVKIDAQTVGRRRAGHAISRPDKARLSLVGCPRELVRFTIC